MNEEKRFTSLMVKKDLKDDIEFLRHQLSLRTYSEVINFLIEMYEVVNDVKISGTNKVSKKAEALDRAEKSGMLKNNNEENEEN
jgi:hypothetical protein